MGFQKFFLITFIFLCVLGIFAQSGRVKSAETPSPSPTPRRLGGYVPTEKNLPITNPSPTQTPKNESEEDDVIRVSSNLVPIPVSVLDERRRPVTNLKLEDFLLLVDGIEAEVSEILRAETPVRLVLLFDNSSSVSVASEFEKKAASRFFRRVIRTDKDLAAIFTVSTVSRLEQALTGNISELVRAIESFPPPQGATALLDGIIKAAEYLKETDGRRIIVIVSDGDDTVSEATFDQTLKILQMTNCQVYVVKTTDFENFKLTGRRTGNANLRQLVAERRMQEIALQTGGAVYSPIDETELENAFTQIAAELAQQYILSYYPENESEFRGKFRRISLTIRNQPNLSVRTRKGYYVPQSVNR
jgi:Ca-activated chloride channel family protein